jgi:transposase-like protein
MAKNWRWESAACARLRQMKGHGTKFGRKKEEAIAALLTQRNLDEAAKSIGIAPNTLLKWMKQPEFDAAYREARRAAFGQAVARLQQGTSAAATTLLKTMIDPNTPASVRVRAAECVMNHATKAIEIEDIEARVAALEATAASGQQPRR